MPRNYQRKGPKRCEANIRNSVSAVLNGSSKKRAAKDFNIPRTTLGLHVDNNQLVPSPPNNEQIKLAKWGRQTVSQNSLL